MLNNFLDLFGCVILGSLGCVEQIGGSIWMRYFVFFGLCWTNSWIYSNALFWVVWVMLNKSVDLCRCVILGCGEQMCGAIRMCYFGLFGLCWTNSWIYSNALFWVVWVMLNKSVDLWRCLILGCGEQMCGSIRMCYFGLFGLCCSNSWIYSDGLFWVVWV